jgi:NAD-dependent SIR2 family protein deacetylase
MTTKICVGCKEPRSLDEFYKDGRRLNGLWSRCILCIRIASKTPESRLKRNAYRQSPNAQTSLFKTSLKRKFRMSPEDYEYLLDAQDGRCALCKRAFDSKLLKLSVDHDHKHVIHSDGAAAGCIECIRGLLCSNCNRVVLPVLERDSDLQSDVVKKYLSQRPLKEKYDRINFGAAL